MRPIIALVFLLLAHSVAAQSDADYHYDGMLTIEPDSGRIDANWRITVFDDAQGSITFLLRDTLADIDVNGSAVQTVEFGTEEGLAEFKSIRIGLTLGEKRRVIRLSYGGVLIPEPMDNRINAITPDRVELNVDSFWLPMDKSFEKRLTSDLQVNIGKGWQGITTGTTEFIENGVRFINNEPDIDIAFTLARNFHISEADGFTIYDQRTDRSGTEELIEATRYCVNYLNERYGRNDPLPRGKLLITNRPSSGYARLNYVVFTDIATTKPGPLTRFVCHEFSHYWNRGAAFNTVENWLNEAFAEYVGLMAVRARFGDKDYDAMLKSFSAQIAEEDLPPVWRKGDSARGPYLVQYRKGPLALARLEKEMGTEAFVHFVQSFLGQSERTTPMLLTILERVSGKAQRSRFEDALAGRDIAYY